MASFERVIVIPVERKPKEDKDGNISIKTHRVYATFGLKWSYDGTILRFDDWAEMLKEERKMGRNEEYAIEKITEVKCS